MRTYTPASSLILGLWFVKGCVACAVSVCDCSTHDTIECDILSFWSTQRRLVFDFARIESSPLPSPSNTKRLYCDIRLDPQHFIWS